MNKATLIVRSLVGLIFVVFGLNGFLNFLPMPAPAPAAGKFYMALMATGYFLPLLKITEIVAGTMLLSNKLPALGIILLAPIIVQIFFFHAVLDPAGLAMPVFLVLAEGFLGFSYLKSYKGVLEVNAKLD